MITVSNVNGQLKVVYPNKTEYYQFPKLSNLSWVLNEDGFYYVLFTYESDYFVKLKLSDVTNQPTWTNTQPGAELAVNTIASWIGVSFSTSLLATEATLIQVLQAVDNMRDYEVRLVEDSSLPNSITWLEVRYWDAQSGTLGAPQYYLPGSSTPGSPVLPISYINDRTLLTQILATLQGTLTVAGTVALDAPTLSALENITVQNGPGAAAVNIQDGGNAITVDDGGGSITVDGTVTTVPSGTQNVNITSSVPIAVTDNGGSLTVDGTVALDATTLTALENITVQNGAGANAVNIQDGGNSITVDGSVSVNNFPSSFEIANDSGNPIPVSGTVTITDGSGPITVDGTVAATQSGTWNINNITGSVALPTGAATESTLNALNTQFTAVTRTPSILRTSASGSISAGARAISVYNAGAVAGGVLGGVGNILPGEIFSFEAGGENDTLAAFAYNGTGTTLVITAIV